MHSSRSPIIGRSFPRVIVATCLIWPVIVGLGVASCSSGPNQPAEVRDTIDWRDIPQFKSISIAEHGNGIAVLWIVTVKGELFRQVNLGPLSRVEVPSEVGKPDLISFADSLHGWIVNQAGTVSRTINGGQSWESLATTKAGGDRFYLPKQLVFVSATTGWLINNFTIWRTNDGGVSWKQLISSKDVAPKDIWKPFHGWFLDSSKAWIATSDGVLTTKDGGETWEPRAVKAKLGFKDVQFIDERIGWTAGGLSGIYRSDDGGITWIQQLSGERDHLYLNSVYFPTLTNGWAVGFQTHGELRDLNRGVILHTGDGGKTWRNIKAGENELFFDRVCFADEQHGWLFGRDALYQTQDGGDTWKVVLQLPPIKDAP